MNGYRGLVVLSFYFVLALPAAGQPPAAGSSEGLIAKIQAEVATLTKGPVSDVFDTLTSESGGASLRLTNDQVEFSRRLDELVRAILKGGLLRGLDAKPLPPVTELAARLDEASIRERQAVISHAEAMALEIILRPNQANRLRKATGARPASTLLGRYRTTRGVTSEAIHSVAELTAEVKEERQRLERSDGACSALFQAVVIYRQTIDATFSSEQVELSKTLKVSRAQIDLARRLNRLICDILVEGLSRKMAADLARLEEHEAVDWYDAWARQRDSFVAHGEVLLLRGVLSPFQASALLASYWRQVGPYAMADPELLSRLKLSRAKRSTLADQLINRRIIYDETVLYLLGLMESRGKMDELGRDIGEVAREEKGRVQHEADWLVWGVLTPSQLSKLNQILRSDSRPPQPTASQKRRTGPG